MASMLLIAWMAFFVLSPVLDIGGHFIYPPELFLYILVLWRFLASIMGSSGIVNTPLGHGAVKANITYAILFICNALFTAYLAGQTINNYDIFIFRNIIQVALCAKLFSIEIQKIEIHKKLDRVIFVVIIILCLPALIVYLQRLDIMGLRNLIVDIYKTQFFFLGRETFSAYRYASVFKDFFTASVYFIMLSSFIYYFSLKTVLNIFHRLFLIFLLVFIYGAQFFVSRSSLVMIPLMIGAISLFGIRIKMSVLVKRIIPLLILVALTGSFFSQYIFESGLVNKKWSIEARTFATDKGQASSSFEVMQNWYENYFMHMGNDKYSLLKPRHSYELTEQKNPGFYTDSFYGQELYRYGIYGLLAYLIYLFFMFFTHWPRSRYIVILVVALAALNYKGGNTFFMPKNIYLYAFILAAVPFIEARRSDKVENFISNPSIATSTR